MEKEKILDSEYFRERPPRQLSTVSQAGIFFGGFFNMFGWIFFGFGMIFVWVFSMSSTASLLLKPGGSWEQTTGTVVKITPTSYSENEVTVDKLEFNYQIQGNYFKGKSYSTKHNWPVGQEVTVEYKNRNPDRARIAGTREKPFGFLPGVLVLIFPMVGLIFILMATKNNAKSLYLLKNGFFTRGTMLSKVATSSTVNDHPVYKYEFSFQADERSYIAVCKTHQTQLVEDEKEEIILYDDRDPSFNVVYDVIPIAPDLDSEGRFVENHGKAIANLILPGIVIIGHSLVALIFLLS